MCQEMEIAGHSADRSVRATYSCEVIRSEAKDRCISRTPST